MTREEEAQLTEQTTWFYRTQIKDPRDTVEQIACEVNLPVEIVVGRIAEARRLLSLSLTPKLEQWVQQEMRTRLRREN